MNRNGKKHSTFVVNTVEPLQVAVTIKTIYSASSPSMRHLPKSLNTIMKKDYSWYIAIPLTRAEFPLKATCMKNIPLQVVIQKQSWMNEFSMKQEYNKANLAVY